MRATYNITFCTRFVFAELPQFPFVGLNMYVAHSATVISSLFIFTMLFAQYLLAVHSNHVTNYEMDFIFRDKYRTIMMAMIVSVWKYCTISKFETNSKDQRQNTGQLYLLPLNKNEMHQELRNAIYKRFRMILNNVCRRNIIAEKQLVSSSIFNEHIVRCTSSLIRISSFSTVTHRNFIF